MLLLGQGLPRSAISHLQAIGMNAVHASEIGLSTADDAPILEYARDRDFVVVTLDADFHMHMALAKAAKPSVIRIRMEGLRGAALAAVLRQVIPECKEELEQGASVSVTDSGIRIRRLPLLG
jgi:predicted nuclease of predicted toxin-antitoxin system